MEPIRVGIVGTGIIARAHAQGVLRCPAATLAALCDIDPGQIKDFRARTGIAAGAEFTDYRRMLEGGAVDAVLICTPPDSHRDIALCAARHGVHVFCEKPLARNAGEAAEMLAAVRESRVVHMVGFAFRHIPAMEYIKSLVDAGALGEIRHFRGRFFANRLAPPSHPLEWRHVDAIAGSGVIGDLISHTLDMAHHLVFGDYGNIARLAAHGSILIPTRIDPATGLPADVTADETMAVWMKCHSGAEITLESSRYSPFETEFHLTGSKGAVRYNMAHYNSLELMRYEVEGQYSQNYSQTYERVEVPAPFARPAQTEDRFVWEQHLFAAAIGGEAVSHADFAEGLENQKMLDRIKAAYLADRGA